MTAVHDVAQDYLQLARVLPAAIVLVLLWCWETFAPHAVGRPERVRHAGSNLSLAAINGIVLFFTLGLATTLVAAWAAERRFGLLNVWHIGWPVQLAIGFLILDAWAYCWHRANHASSFLWRFHRLHHSDHEMDCTTSSRFHFGELAIAATSRLPVIALCGLAPLTIILHEIALVAVSQFHHANICLGHWDRPLRWLIVTPAMHRIHHSRRLPETNSNYASVLSIWDRAFQSFNNPEHVAEIELGLDEFQDKQWHTIPQMLLLPVANARPNEMDNAAQ